MTAGPEAFGRTGDDEMLGDLTNTKVPAGWGRKVGPALTGRAADARLPLVLLAQHASDLEGAMGVHTWRHKRGGPRRLGPPRRPRSAGTGARRIELLFVADR